MPDLPARREFLKGAGLFGAGLVAAPLVGAAAAPVVDSASVVVGANVLAHGVVADGTTKNTAALNALITSLARAGGGTLYFPPGTYLTGPLHLQSNIGLQLEAGATLKFSDHFDDYLPFVRTRWQGLEVRNFSPLIYAVGVENIAITGRGTIDGSGFAWWEQIRQLRVENRRTGKTPETRWRELFVQENGREGEQLGFCRPSLLQVLDCRRVRIEGVRFTNSPFWTVHLVGSEDIVVDGISIFNAGAPNTDGINPESCRNVRIANSLIEVEDDCVTLKAGKNEWGRRQGGACENITITNCVMRHGAAGVAIGSEMSGGVRRVTVSNCVFEGTRAGLHLKTVRGRGGVVEDVVVTNLAMFDVWESAAIQLNTLYWTPTKPAPRDEGTPTFRNIHISGVRGSRLRRAALIRGLEERSLQNVTLSDIDLDARHGMTASFVDGLNLRNVRIATSEDTPLRCDNVARLDVDGFHYVAPRRTLAAIALHDVRGAMLTRCAHGEKTQALLAVTGTESRDIVLTDARWRKEPDVVQVGSEVRPGEVVLDG